MATTRTQKEQNVVDLLIDQHHEIKQLFRDVARAEGEQKQDLFADLVRLLAVHESAEEQVVHPATRRKVDDGDDIAEARLSEEEEAKRALAELYDLGVEHPDFDSRLAMLAEAVTQHADNEEAEEFPQLREALKPAELSRMAGALKAAEAVAPTRPHPMVGESGMANLMAGPPLAMFDRARDAVRDWQGKRH